MSWFSHIANLSNPFDLASLYIRHILYGDIQLVILDAVLILTIHGFYIFFLARLFGKVVHKTKIGKSLKGGLLMYSLMIVLVASTHIMDIFALALALDSFKVFGDPLSTFHYVSGMYTTIGSNLDPRSGWEGLSLILSFTGLLAFSISGSGLYTMLGYFISSEKGN
jgi:hypothetical protein